jgi:ribosomal protein S18 acetylase RimI-like enzyme
MGHTPHVRLAQPTDEPALVGICTRAFLNDDLFGRVIHPHRAQFPDDVSLYWREWLRTDWQNARNRLIVAVAPSSPANGSETILGLAIWQRQGDDAGGQKIQTEHRAPGAFSPAESRVSRALDPVCKDILHRAAPFSAHLWADDRAQTWYLVLCCVDPEAERRGAGRVLVEWGLRRASEEGVCASVIASEGNAPFYIKCGYDKVVGNACEGIGNPMGEAGTKGGDVLFMWARASRGDIAEDGDRKHLA